MKKLGLVLSFLIISAVSLSAATWNFDATHTSVGFEVSHMVISSVDGKFQKFDGSVVTEGNSWENATVNFTIQVNSIDTDNDDRDNHLKSADFFDAEKYPTITFKGKSMKKVDDNEYELVGDLTMRGVTKEVTLEVEHNGTITDPYGNTRAGFSIEGSLNRFDYGLEWSKTLDTGGLVVGNEVDIKIEAELLQQK